MGLSELAVEMMVEFTDAFRGVEPKDQATPGMTDDHKGCFFGAGRALEDGRLCQAPQGLGQ